MESDFLTSGNILGFQPWVIYLVVFVAILVLMYWYYKRKNKGVAQQKEQTLVYCTFGLHSGQKEHYWCAVDENEIGLSADERKRLEKIAKSLGHDDKIEKWYKGDLTKVNALKLPVDIEGGKYFISSEFIFDDDHPLDMNKPKGQRRRIKTCDYMVGIPLPIMGVTLAKWTTDMIEKYTSSLIGAADDKAALQLLNMKDHGLLDNLSKVAQAMSQFNQLKWACFIAAGGSVIGAGIAFMGYQAIQSWGG
jgi:hypothetical protein